MNTQTLSLTQADLRRSTACLSVRASPIDSQSPFLFLGNEGSGRGGRGEPHLSPYRSCFIRGRGVRIPPLSRSPSLSLFHSLSRSLSPSLTLSHHLVVLNVPPSTCQHIQELRKYDSFYIFFPRPPPIHPLQGRVRLNVAKPVASQRKKIAFHLSSYISSSHSDDQ